MIKRQDFITLLIVIFVSGIFSIVASSFLFKVSSSSQEVEVVPAFSSQFPTTKTNIFKGKSIDPTVNIQINGNNNSAIFGSGQ